MLQRKKIPTNGQRTTPDVFLSNGFVKYVTETHFHDVFVANGVKTSPGNSERLFEKDGIVYIFDRWEGDSYDRRAKEPSFIEIVDVTSLVQ